MFKAQPPGVQIEAAIRQLVAVYRSVNEHAISLGGGPMRPARATVLGVYLPSGSYALYVHLGAARRDADGSRPGLLFRADPPEVGLGDYERLQREAVEMVETQGFQLERVDIRVIPDAERDDILVGLPIRILDAAQSDGIALSTAATMAPASVAARAPGAGPAGPLLVLDDASRADALGTASHALPLEMSAQISLPRMQTIEAFGRLLSLF